MSVPSSSNSNSNSMVYSNLQHQIGNVATRSVIKLPLPLKSYTGPDDANHEVASLLTWMLMTSVQIILLYVFCLSCHFIF